MAGKWTLFKSGDSSSFPSPHHTPQCPVPTPPRLLRLSIFSLQITALVCQRVTASVSSGHVRMTQWWHAPAEGIREFNAERERGMKEVKHWKQQLIFPNERESWMFPEWCKIASLEPSNTSEVKVIYYTVHTEQLFEEKLLVWLLSYCVGYKTLLDLPVIVYLNWHPTCSPHFSGYLSSCHPP